MSEIHNVTEDELPTLLLWLKGHLPITWKLYGTLREQLRGKWQGTTFYTLGWPDILAVSEGPVNQQQCKAVKHYTDPRRTTIFASVPADTERMLTWPGYLDWSQPLIFHTLSSPIASVVMALSQKHGCSLPRCVPLTLMTANPGDIQFSKDMDPDDLIIRSLNPESDVPFILSNWEYASTHTGLYVKELLKSFPSVGAFTKEGTCLGTETGTEWGFMGMLYVSPEARGRGLGKLLTCRLAEEYFSEGLPAVIVTSIENLGSIALHEALGFKQLCPLNLIYHTPDSIEAQIN